MGESYNPNNRPNLPDGLPSDVAFIAAKEAMSNFDTEWREFDRGRSPDATRISETDPPLTDNIDELTQEAETLAPSSAATIPDLNTYDQPITPVSEYDIHIQESQPPQKRSLRQKLGRVLPINTGRHTVPHVKRLKRSLSRARNIFKTRN
jgi:hypothetical protein